MRQRDSSTAMHGVLFALAFNLLAAGLFMTAVMVIVGLLAHFA